MIDLLNLYESINTLSDSDIAKQTGLSNSDQSSYKATVKVEQGVQMRAPRDKKVGPLRVVNQAVDKVDAAQRVQTRAQNEDEGRVQSPKVVYEIVVITDVAQGVQSKFKKERDTVEVQHSNVLIKLNILLNLHKMYRQDSRRRRRKVR